MRFRNSRLPEHSTAVGTYVKLILEVNERIGVDTAALQVKTSIGWKLKLCHLLTKLCNGMHEINLVLSFNSRPALMEMDAFGMLHYDVLAAHNIRGIVVPLNHSRNGQICS